MITYFMIVRRGIKPTCVAQDATLNDLNVTVQHEVRTMVLPVIKGT